MTTSTQPLAGVKVIDFTQVMLGPCCTQTLGDYGADVIKIERIGAGDLSRTAIPDRDGLRNPVFCSLNRNKPSGNRTTDRPTASRQAHSSRRTAGSSLET